MAAAYLSRQGRQARDVLGGFSQAAVSVLQEEAATLPARCDLFSEALRAAPAAVVRQVHQHADTAMVRAAVAKAVIALREAGFVDEHLAAAALIDLTKHQSALCEAAMRQAIVEAPPAGLTTMPSTAVTV